MSPQGWSTVSPVKAVFHAQHIGTRVVQLIPNAIGEKREATADQQRLEPAFCRR
jgi:hypothetical protein